MDFYPEGILVQKDHSSLDIFSRLSMIIVDISAGSKLLAFSS